MMLGSIESMQEQRDFLQEGGDFWMGRPNPNPENSKTYKLDFMQTRGAVVVFPSYAFHKVAPVTKGVRHSLVCWMRGKKWR